MRRLTVLITNWTMIGRHGSVMYIRDLALWLIRNGHRPIVYAPELGEVASELHDRTIAVVTDLATLAELPDIILGNSSFDFLAALVHFPTVPGVFVCHAWDTPIAIPPEHPNSIHYIAVDETCRDSMTVKQGIPPERVSLHQNGVDLSRFRARGPLPERASRALIFSNYADESTHLPAIREACRRLGITLDVIGTGVGRPCHNPEQILPEYDLVFAKGRAATEAAAVGCSVILCDTFGFGGMVTAENWRQLRRLNFGRRALQWHATPERVVANIEQYNAADSLEVCRQVRAAVDLDLLLPPLVKQLEQSIDDFARSHHPNPLAEARAASVFYQRLAPIVAAWHRGQREARHYQDQVQQARADLAEVHSSAERRHAEVDSLQAQVRQYQSKVGELRNEEFRLKAELGSLRAELARVNSELSQVREQAHAREQLEQELTELRNSRTVRTREWFRRVGI